MGSVVPKEDPVYGHFNDRDRRRVWALQRRAAWLEKRVENYKPHGNPSHDEAELSAIRWALSIIATVSPEIIAAASTRRAIK